MLRPRGTASANHRPVLPATSTSDHVTYPYRSTGRKSIKQRLVILTSRLGIAITMALGAFVAGMLVQHYFQALQLADVEPIINKELSPYHPPPRTSDVQSQSQGASLPEVFHAIRDRSLLHRKHCQSIGRVEHEDHWGVNNHTAHLPQFGILDVMRNYKDTNDYPYQCQLPPENECGESQFTVIFMAYNPDRLQKMYNQIFKMLSDAEFAPLVAEVVVVWNGERHVDETKLGKALVDLGKEKPVRISYPLKAGFPNDLMNRYHPRLEIKTKAIMYYDDDGPFYSFKATLGGFELWKRNSNAQIGAMARKLDLSPRQADERQAILNGAGDRFFISHCPKDEVRYNFNEFANFGANMVLPSGSFLHSNYLCFLWHPLFEEIREYVRQHPVNPDDGTVSVIVSQLGARAPKVYSRRINESKDGRRRLLDLDIDSQTDDKPSYEEEEGLSHRRLMDGINWDKGGGHDKKNKWGQLRSDAANSLLRYFGSINSGSIGWCYGSQYQDGLYCKPGMARIGQLPWLKPDHTPRDTCP